MKKKIVQPETIEEKIEETKEAEAITETIVTKELETSRPLTEAEQIVITVGELGQRLEPTE